MFTHILLASDGSECALKAAEAAGALAEKFGARLTILHVFVPPTLPVVPIATGRMAMGVDPAQIERWADAAMDAVGLPTGHALEVFDVVYTFRLEIGHPAEVILRVASEENCDVIVLGSRGLSGVKEFLLGSVSNRVTHHAHCPVMVVR